MQFDAFLSQIVFGSLHRPSQSLIDMGMNSQRSFEKHLPRGNSINSESQYAKESIIKDYYSCICVVLSISIEVSSSKEYIILPSGEVLALKEGWRVPLKHTSSLITG